MNNCECAYKIYKLAAWDLLGTCFLGRHFQADVHENVDEIVNGKVQDFRLQSMAVQSLTWLKEGKSLWEARTKEKIAVHRMSCAGMSLLTASDSFWQLLTASLASPTLTYFPSGISCQDMPSMQQLAAMSSTSCSPYPTGSWQNVVNTQKNIYFCGIFFGKQSCCRSSKSRSGQVSVSVRVKGRVQGLIQSRKS